MMVVVMISAEKCVDGDDDDDGDDGDEGDDGDDDCCGGAP